MPVTKTVRIIRTCDVKIKAEFGDTPESLCERAKFEDSKCDESRLLLPDEDDA